MMNQMFSLIEIRVVRLILSQTRRSKLDKDTWYGITTEEYAEACGIVKRTAYSMLKETCEKLQQREEVVSSARFLPEEHRIEVKFRQKFIIELQKEVRKLDNLAPCRLASVYSIRLLDLLTKAGRRRTGTVRLDVEELMERLCVPENRRKYSGFKRGILLPVLEELGREEVVRVELVGERRLGS